MSLSETVRVQCPYCWEQIDILVDLSLGDQQYVEDCFVCCRPIELDIALDGEGFPSVQVTRENE